MSKVGKWLTNDGETAVVLAVDERGNLHGVNYYKHLNHWEARSWEPNGYYHGSETGPRTLSRRVSDSTDLTPYVPVKRVRPWTRAEVEAIVQQRPLWVRHREREDAYLIYCIRGDGLIVNGFHVTFKAFAELYHELDGSPCGVEVEE